MIWSRRSDKRCIVYIVCMSGNRVPWRDNIQNWIGWQSVIQQNKFELCYWNCTSSHCYWHGLHTELTCGHNWGKLKPYTLSKNSDNLHLINTEWSAVLQRLGVPFMDPDDSIPCCNSRLSLQCPWIQVFWEMAPCQLLNSYQRCRPAFFLHFESPTWTLKMESESASETSVKIYQSKQHYIAEDLNAHYLVYKRLPHVLIRTHINVLHKFRPYFFTRPFQNCQPMYNHVIFLSRLLH